MATPDNMDNWNALAAQQRDTRETEQMDADQKLFDGFVNIETAARDRQLALNHQRAIAGAAMIDSAFRNGGMSDRSLSQAFSEAFGQPIYGGQILDLPDGKGKAFVMYGATKDQQTGEAKVAPVAMMDGAQMMKVLQSAKLGGRTEGVQKAIYGDLSSRFTPDQLGKMGIQNPSAPISTGGVVISAAGMRALRGEPRPRSTISVFSNIGGDGKVGTGTRSATIRPDGTREEVTTGSRREDAPGRWRVLSVGPDPSDEKGERQIRRYENDKTGEVVDVPEGSSLGDIIAARQHKQGSGLTFDERRQLQQEREDRLDARQKANVESRKETEKERSDRHREGRLRAWENTHYSAIERRLEKMRSAKIKRNGLTEEPQYTPEQIAEEEKRLYDQMDADRAKAFPELGGSNSGTATSAPTQASDKGGASAVLKVAKDGNSITMPDGTVVEKGKTYTDSKGRKMTWVGPGEKDWTK